VIIFLIGFMGSGKSFWATQLAQKLGCLCVDLDTLIVQGEQKSIAQIFEQQGESHFRALEQQYLSELIDENGKKNLVVATGGGTPTVGQNMDLMLRSGCVVYLQASTTLLAQRLQSETEHRPLLRGKNQPELERFITEKLTQREQHYQRAHFTITQDAANDDLLEALFVQIKDFFVRQ
jgi:shikimate kinase